MPVTTIHAGQWTAQQLQTAQDIWDEAKPLVRGYDDVGPGLSWQDYTVYLFVSTGTPVFAMAVRPHVQTILCPDGTEINGTDEMCAYVGPRPSLSGTQVLAVVRATFRAWLDDVILLNPNAVCYGFVPAGWNPALMDYYQGAIKRSKVADLGNGRLILYDGAQALRAAS